MTIPPPQTYQEQANLFIKQHEGIGYQSQPQMVAVRAFAEWLANQRTTITAAAFRKMLTAYALERPVRNSDLLIIFADLIGWLEQREAQPKETA